MATSRARASTAGVLDQYLASAGLLLALVGVDAMRRLRSALADVDLTPRQFQVLGLLHGRGPLAQQDLNVEVGVAPSVLVTLLNPLEAGGFVRRERDPEDRRRHVVVLTDRGAEHLTAASAALAGAEAGLFAMFEEPQREHMTTLLTAMRDGLTIDTADEESSVAGPSALERAALLVADADRRRATHPRDAGGLL